MLAVALYRVRRFRPEGRPRDKVLVQEAKKRRGENVVFDGFVAALFQLPLPPSNLISVLWLR